MQIIANDTRIYKSQYGTWSFLVKNNLPNGETLKMYVPVAFRKGLIQPDGEQADINIKNSFLSPRLDKNGQNRLYLIIMEYEIINNTIEPTEPIKEVTYPKEALDLPFETELDFY